jgi:VanZ family protein
MSRERFGKHGILLVALTFLVLSATLSAAFWPFSFHPPNSARWLPDGSGLHLGNHPLVISSRALNEQDICAGSGVSLELWLTADQNSSSGTILQFSSPEFPENFALRQSLGDLALARTWKSARGQRKLKLLYVDDEFSRHKQMLATIVADTGETSVFVDGEVKKSSRTFGLSCSDFLGTLLLGNSSIQNHGWNGSVRGLAIYDRSLSAGEAREHFREWSQAGTSSLSVLGAKMLFLFEVGVGSVVRESGQSDLSFNIPAHYAILHQRFLEPFWEEFDGSRAYWEDVAVNVFGFMPLGICLAALSRYRGAPKSVVLATALCFAVSLTIEVLQAYMPLRNSGMTDVITNTTGGLLGGLIYARCASLLGKENWRRPEKAHGR